VGLAQAYKDQDGLAVPQPAGGWAESRTRRPETRHRFPTTGAEERRHGLEGARRPEHGVQRPLDLGLRVGRVQALPSKFDEARRALERATVVAAKETADYTADQLLSRVCHCGLCLARAFAHRT